MARIRKMLVEIMDATPTEDEIAENADLTFPVPKHYGGTYEDGLNAGFERGAEWVKDLVLKEIWRQLKGLDG